MADGAAGAGELGPLCVEVAVAAAQRALSWRREGFSVDTKSTPTDLVTQVDRRVERWIADQLRGRRPDDVMVGEESSYLEPDSASSASSADSEMGSPSGGSSVRWLVDPIDGTVNFALGLPQYAVSIAAEQDGLVVAGCVVNPVSGDVFRAELGRGAYLDSTRDGATPIRLTGPRLVTLDRAVVGTGFGYAAERRSRQGAVLARLLPRIADVRRAGSASLDLCSVAAGWLDAHYEAGLSEWDYAAGLLIASEAGCVSSGLRGRPAGSRFCAVAGASLGPDLFDLLTELDADRVLDER
jgi:myo-inositol-1(or 4)-monophosphatase